MRINDKKPDKGTRSTRASRKSEKIRSLNRFNARTGFPGNDFGPNAGSPGMLESAAVGPAADHDRDFRLQLSGFDSAEEIDQRRAAARDQHAEPNRTVQRSRERPDALNSRHANHLGDSNFLKRRSQRDRLDQERPRSNLQERESLTAKRDPREKVDKKGDSPIIPRVHITKKYVPPVNDKSDWR